MFTIDSSSCTMTASKIETSYKFNFQTGRRVRRTWRPFAPKFFIMRFVVSSPGSEVEKLASFAPGQNVDSEHSVTTTRLASCSFRLMPDIQARYVYLAAE